MIGTSLIKFTIRKHTKMHFLNLSQNFTKFLTFFIAKLLSKLKIYTNSKKKFKFGKKQQKKKANFFLKNRII